MKTIAIVAGGDSSEYGVSVKSAQGVAEALEGRYKTYIIVIRGSDWYWEDSKERAFPIDKNDFSLHLEDERIRFDAVFVAIHGTPGENGLLQGYFDMLRIPYTSCGAFSSALTFNKQACKLYLKEYGIPMTEGILIRQGDKIDPEKIAREIGLPCFVKPNASGSSFGVTKVKSAGQLTEAVDKAFKEGDEVMIESFMKGTETACGVMKTKNRKIILPVTEIVPKNDFFDYEAKYTDGLSEEITPARLSEEITSRIQDLSAQIYDLLSCRGIVRVDFIVTPKGPQFLEINTVPGMTRESIIPRQAGVFGLSLSDLYTMVIEDIL